MAYDQLTADWLKLYQPDVVAYAGYVWATTEALADAFMGVNVHPADLSVVKSECRAYAGAHGVRDALLAGEPEFRSSAHLVTTEVDGGPLLMLSRPVAYEAQKELPLEEASRYYLRLLNQQGRLLFARVIRDMAEGRFQIDDKRNLYHDSNPIPSGICL